MQGLIMKKLFLILSFPFALIGCDGSDIGSCKAYGSKHSCDYVQNQATYNVLFYFPRSGSESKEYFVGTAKGLQQCGAQARSYALKKGSGNANYDWAYICCMQTKDSSCEEKHR
jgi:hypothetical protein